MCCPEITTYKQLVCPVISQVIGHNIVISGAAVITKLGFTYLSYNIGYLTYNMGYLTYNYGYTTYNMGYKSTETHGKAVYNIYKYIYIYTYYFPIGGMRGNRGMRRESAASVGTDFF